MKRIIKQISIITAIILCILTVFSAMGTYVQNGSDVKTARFFAMSFSHFIHASSSPSIWSGKRYYIVSWMKKNDTSFDEDKVYKPSKIFCDLHCNLKTIQKDICFKENLYNKKNNTSYYMRI